MIRLVELIGIVNEKGCIEIPVVPFSQTGIQMGEEVRLVYFAAGEYDYRNESREFMLARVDENPMEELLKEERVELKLPPEILSDSGIPFDADLDIVCMNRKIVILPAEDVEREVPKELFAICEELGIPKEKINIVLKMTEEEDGKKPNL